MWGRRWQARTTQQDWDARRHTHMTRAHRTGHQAAASGLAGRRHCRLAGRPGVLTFRGQPSCTGRSCRGTPANTTRTKVNLNKDGSIGVRLGFCLTKNPTRVISIFHRINDSVVSRITDFFCLSDDACGRGQCFQSIRYTRENLLTKKKAPLQDHTTHPFCI